jgi:hypothetical protein
MKRGSLTSAAFQNLFLAQTLGSSANYAYLGVDYTSGYGYGVLVFEDFTSSVSRGLVKTNSLFRDPSAWYHVVLVFDTTNATAANRILIYVNGVSQPLTITTQIALNQNGYMNTGSVPHFIGTNNSNPSSNFFDGYMTEINFVNGLALTPSAFGQNNPATGVWEPKSYGGSYGTNGFYLNFSDNSAATAAAIGKDYSGNGNNWTPTNISVTSGVTYDSMIDVPTPYDDGTVTYNRGNYCVMNGLIVGTNLSNANLRNTTSYAEGTIYVSSGKWYFEAIPTTSTVADSNTYYVGLNGPTLTVYALAGTRWTGSAWVAFGASYATNDVIGVAVDLGAGTAAFYKNNVLQGTQTITAGGNYVFASNISSSNTGSLFNYNFGQRPFAYTPPSGFVALNTFNLSTPTIANGNNHFAATAYSGSASQQTVTNTINGAACYVDLVWAKVRSNTYNHALLDFVRGQNYLSSNTTTGDTATSGVSWLSNGVTWPGGASLFNDTGQTYVAWQWRAGAGTSATNTSGSITSTVSANTTAGFSIVTYTGTGANATVGHGLGVAPSMIITKKRSSTSSWGVYHSSLGNTTYILLDSTAASAASSTYWNNTSPTSTVFSVGTADPVNISAATYVAYCWAAVAGFSAFGSYTGNGSADGPFVYCGFRPRWIMVKNYSSAGNGWAIRDTARDTYNVANQTLIANSTAAEATALYNIDIVSNGFKIRDTGTDSNGSGTSYIFAAFAENPFKYALAR